MKNILFFFFISNIALAQLPNFQFVKETGRLSGDGGREVCLDSFGNIYTLGTESGTLDLDPGPGTYTVAGQGNYNIFIQKLDVTGNFIWGLSFGGGEIIVVTSFIIDKAGNLLCTGTFGGTIDFDPGPGSFLLDSDWPLYNSFVLKLSPSGNFIWARQLDKAYSKMFLGSDVSNNVIICGTFNKSTDFDPGPGTYSLQPGLYNDNMFVLKLNAAGNFLSAVATGSNSYCLPAGICIDNKGQLIIAGSFSGSIDFDPGPATKLLNSAGAFDVFVCKYGAGGNLVWAENVGGSGYDVSKTLALDNDGNVYLCGTFQDTADLNPGIGADFFYSERGANNFILKLDSSGAYSWAKNWAKNGGGMLAGLHPYAMALDHKANIFFTGTFGDTIDFDPGPSDYSLISNGGRDIFISKFTSQGNFEWVIGLGGPYSGLYDGCTDYSSAIATDKAGNVYASGGFSGETDFDPGVATATLNGFCVGFLLKLKDDQITALPDQALNQPLNIFPNPTNGLINISSSTPLNNLEVEIYNSLGALIYKQTMVNENHTIDLSKQQLGLYFMKVMSGDKIIGTQKILREQ